MPAANTYRCYAIALAGAGLHIITYANTKTGAGRSVLPVKRPAKANARCSVYYLTTIGQALPAC